MQIFLNFKGKLTCLKGIPKNQPCTKLPEKLFSKNVVFFQNGSKTCSRGPDRYYEQFAVSIALRSFFWIWFMRKRVAGRPLYFPYQPALWWSLERFMCIFRYFGIILAVFFSQNWLKVSLTCVLTCVKK